MVRLSELPEKITIIKYNDIVKEREVTKYKKITVDQKVIKYKQETEAKEVIKYRVVTKYHEIPEYQNVEVKKFNENKYNEDLTNIANIINDLKKLIKENLKEVKAINTQQKNSYSPEILVKIIDQAKNEANNNPTKYDDFKNEYAEIYEEWKNAEYEASVIWEYQLAGGTDIHYQ